MPQYEITLHQSAQRNLETLSSEQRNRITDTLTQIAGYEQPTGHAKVKHLEGQNGLFRVRCSGLRAICRLQKPELQVLQIRKRNGAYDDIDDLAERMEI